MAESDASESSVLEDLNLSDQIEAELSEEGGSICQAESGPVQLQPYRHEPYRPDSDEEPGPEEPTDNDQPAEAEGCRYSLESIGRLQNTEWYAFLRYI